MFFSTFPYVLRHISEGHIQGAAEGLWARTLEDQLSHPTWPSFKTLANALAILRSGEELSFYELGATLIHQARCRAAGAFLRSGQDVWVSCDEDVEAGEEALSVLVAQVEASKGAAFAAYRLRGDAKWSVGGVAGASGAALEFKGGAGAGLFAVHREAIRNATRWWIDEDDGTLSPLLFHVEARMIVKGMHFRWRGEDVDFCVRLRHAGQPLHVFFLPDVTHDGAPNARHLPPAKPST